MQRFIDQFETSIHLAYPFYYYIGSAALWQKNLQTLRRMREKLIDARAALQEQKSDAHLSTLERLPMEMQLEIVKRLDNGKDLLQLGLSNWIFYHLTQELTLWKELCQYHFSDPRNEKLHRLIKRHGEENVDWKKIFFRLKRRYELKENYAETIVQCQTCKQLVWQVSRANRTRLPIDLLLLEFN